MTFLKLVRVEVFKLRKRSLVWILLGVLILVIVVVYVLLWLVTDQLVASQGAGGPAGVGGVQITDPEQVRANLYLRQAVPFGLQMVQILGTFLAVVPGGAAVGAEYDWHTIRPFITAAPSRRQYLGAKLVAIFVLAFVGAIVGLATALACSAVVTELASSSDYSFVDAAYIGDSLLSFVRTLLAIGPYLAMAVFFGTVGRSATAGIGFTLGILFLETIVTGLLQLSSDFGARLTNAFPGTNVDTLMLENGLDSALRLAQSSSFQVPRVDPIFSALIVVGYLLGFLGAALTVFDRRDITG